jgi:hypothetical protein
LEAIVLLCDYAEALNGKLYTMGAGWSSVVSVQPFNVAVAIRLAIPWGATNQPHHLVLGLETEDGDAVMHPEMNDQQIRVEGDFEVGRPPGMKPGTPIVNCLAFPFGSLDLGDGGYAFAFKVDGTEIGRATFTVQRVQLPPGVVPHQ